MHWSHECNASLDVSNRDLVNSNGGVTGAQFIAFSGPWVIRPLTIAPVVLSQLHLSSDVWPSTQVLCCYCETSCAVCTLQNMLLWSAAAETWLQTFLGSLFSTRAAFSSHLMSHSVQNVSENVKVFSFADFFILGLFRYNWQNAASCSGTDMDTSWRRNCTTVCLTHFLSLLSEYGEF